VLRSNVEGRFVGGLMERVFGKGIPEEHRILYEKVLGEIRLRSDCGLAVLGKPMRAPPDIELAAVQLRKTLELIVLGSLVTNRSALEQVMTSFATKDSPAARKIVRRANPNYWPVPKKQVQVAPGRFEFGEVNGDFLREEEWGMAYGFASDLLHAANPFGSTLLSIRSTPEQLQDIERKLYGWFMKIVTLLNHHLVHLVDTDTFLACLMRTEQGGVQVAVFQRIEPEPPTI
jgi:hypothetical protein